MKEQTKKWLDYADENLSAARVLLDNGLFSPCLQNAQQAVEKMLKAVLVESDLRFRKTHSINELVSRLARNGLKVNVSEDECDLLDSIYLPSKYPVGGALPDFEPDKRVCEQCVAIADRLRQWTEKLTSGS
jgi:HEPN domain-containing protein